MIDQIIDRRQELYRVYTDYKRDVVERSGALASPTPGTPPQKVRGSEQNIRHPSASITLFQVRDRDGGVCRVTGIGSLSCWQDRREEAFAKNVGYGCSLNREVAHAMPWNVDQPVRNVCVCMLSLVKCCWRLVLGSYLKTLGHIWSAR
jgi:hypothetical protein